ncbi:MAG: ABC transporter ATP-binding protein [Fibrobacteres bacterium]|jgi:branched-chain amino acid transport system ATP-binding protein|nr:ABC transporter ATP-binding protein [Fibrobacterota bacterium]
MLELKQVSSRYGAIAALTEVSFSVEKGGLATLIGSNGAGKSTTLRSIMGLVQPYAGEVLFEGRKLNRMPTHKIAALGIALVPEGRAVFANLTVRENLELGGYLGRDGKKLRRDLDHVYELFPRLKERLAQMAGTLSGGEQQMLAIGRALMANPRLLLLDEPSLGLAPLVVKAIFDAIARINADGTTVLLVEQNANLALARSKHAYVLETGRITMSGPSGDLAKDPRVQEAYLGE